MREAALGLILPLLILGGAAPGLAQTVGRFPGCCYVSVGTGLGTYFGDRDENPSNDIGKSIQSSGGMIQLEAGAGISQVVHVAASYGFSRLPRLGSPSVEGYNPYRHSLNLEVPMYVLPSRKVSPYVSPGVGVLFGTVNGQLGVQTAVSPGLAVGVDVGVAPRLSIFLQVAGRLPMGDERLDGVGGNSLDLVVLATGGIRYSFLSSRSAPEEGITPTSEDRPRQGSDGPVVSQSHLQVEDVTAPEIEKLPKVVPVYSRSLDQFILRVDSFRVSDPESRIASIEHRLSRTDDVGNSTGANDESDDWTILAEPRSTQFLVAGFARDLPADSGSMVLEFRIRNTAGLPHHVRIPFEYRLDTTPPNLSETPAYYLQIDGKKGLEILGNRIRDDESGVSRIRYRVVGMPRDSIFVDWTELRNSGTTFLPDTEHAFGEVDAVRVDLSAVNGHGLEEFFTVTVPTQEESTAVTEPRPIRVEQAPAEPVVVPEKEDPDDTPPTLGSIRAYARSGVVHVFVENLADRESAIERAEYRLLDVNGVVVADWAAYPLIPAGRSHYRILLHKVKIEGATTPTAIEFRARNGAGLLAQVKHTLD